MWALPSRLPSSCKKCKRPMQVDHLRPSTNVYRHQCKRHSQTSLEPARPEVRTCGRRTCRRFLRPSRGALQDRQPASEVSGCAVSVCDIAEAAAAAATAPAAGATASSADASTGTANTATGTSLPHTTHCSGVTIVGDNARRCLRMLNFITQQYDTLHDCTTTWGPLPVHARRALWN